MASSNRTSDLYFMYYLSVRFAFVLRMMGRILNILVSADVWRYGKESKYLNQGLFLANANSIGFNKINII